MPKLPLWLSLLLTLSSARDCGFPSKFSRDFGSNFRTMASTTSTLAAANLAGAPSEFHGGRPMEQRPGAQLKDLFWAAFTTPNAASILIPTWHAHAHVDWEEVADVTDEWQSASGPARMVALSNSLAPMFALVASAGRVKMLYGFKVRFGGNDRQVYCVTGDAVAYGGNTLPPQLMGSTSDQLELATTTCNLPPLEIIKAQLADDMARQWLDVPEDSPEHVVPEFMVVHPLLAVLFWRARSPRQALEKAFEIMEVVPDGLRARLMPVVHYCAAAMTRKDPEAEPPTSALTSQWVDVNPNSGELTKWYLQLISFITPAPPPASGRQPPATDLVASPDQAAPSGLSAATIDQLIRAQLAPVPEPAANSTSQPYQPHELELLYVFCGVSPEDAEGEQTIPLFWKGLSKVRKNTASSRVYMEATREKHIVCRFNYQFMFTPGQAPRSPSATITGWRST